MGNKNWLNEKEIYWRTSVAYNATDVSGNLLLIKHKAIKSNDQAPTCTNFNLQLIHNYDSPQIII